MKPTGFVLIVVAALLLAASVFFGYFSFRNSGSADRLARTVPSGGGWVVTIVKNKAKKQMFLALGLGVPAVLVMGGGIFMIRRGRRTVVTA